MTAVDSPPTDHRPQLTLSLTPQPGGARLLSVAGEVDIATVDAFRTMLLAALDADHPHVMVDAARLAFCDAQGLDALAAAGDLAEALGGRITIINARPLIVRMLRITGLHRQFAVTTAITRSG